MNVEVVFIAADRQTPVGACLWLREKPISFDFSWTGEGEGEGEGEGMKP